MGLTMILHGPAGCGKTALAAHLARTSDFPFVRRIAAENYVGYSEQAKVNAIAKIFEDAYKSPLSLVVLDDLERLMDYVRVGPRFNNLVLQAMFALVKKQPPKTGRRLLVIGTTSEPGFLEEVDLLRVFNAAITVPLLSAAEHYKIGIRTVLLIAEMAVQRQNPVQKDVFMDCLMQC